MGGARGECWMGKGVRGRSTWWVLDGEGKLRDVEKNVLCVEESAGADCAGCDEGMLAEYNECDVEAGVWMWRGARDCVVCDAEYVVLDEGVPASAMSV